MIERAIHEKIKSDSDIVVIHPLEHETFRNNNSVNINNDGEGFCSLLWKIKFMRPICFGEFSWG